MDNRWDVRWIVDNRWDIRWIVDNRWDVRWIVDKRWDVKRIVDKRWDVRLIVDKRWNIRWIVDNRWDIKRIVDKRWDVRWIVDKRWNIRWINWTALILKGEREGYLYAVMTFHSPPTHPHPFTQGPPNLVNPISPRLHSHFQETPKQCKSRGSAGKSERADHRLSAN